MDNNAFTSYANLINATAQANNEWSASQAQRQMEFQERMSNTAHQREVADLKAAGLNPVLSAGGSGATTGSGAMGGTDTSNTAAMMQLLNKALDANIVNGKAASNYSLKSISDDVTNKINKSSAKRASVINSEDDLINALHGIADQQESSSDQNPLRQYGVSDEEYYNENPRVYTSNTAALLGGVQSFMNGYAQTNLGTKANALDKAMYALGAELSNGRNGVIADNAKGLVNSAKTAVSNAWNKVKTWYRNSTEKAKETSSKQKYEGAT